MDENPNLAGDGTPPDDPARIDLHAPHDVAYWTRRWNVTPQQLNESVATVGTRIEDVARHLGKPL